MSDSHWIWLLAAIPAVAGILLLLWRRWQLRRRDVEWQLGRVSREVLRDIALPDGMEGLAYIDFLALTPSGICVILVRDYEGAIFGAEEIEQWTQMVGGGSHPFPNPLHQLQDLESAVRARVPAVPVFGYVVFTDKAVFPRTRPAGVLQPENLQKTLAAHGQRRAEIPRDLEMAWAELKLQLHHPQG